MPSHPLPMCFRCEEICFLVTSKQNKTVLGISAEGLQDKQDMCPVLLLVLTAKIERFLLNTFNFFRL